MSRGARGRLQEPSNEKNQKSLQKTLDKTSQVCYNKDVVKRDYRKEKKRGK